jgi:hypothetical protein
MSKFMKPKQQDDELVITRPPRMSRERWILVRQGAGPNRKWVWQLSGAASADPPGQRGTLRQ